MAGYQDFSIGIRPWLRDLWSIRARVRTPALRAMPALQENAALERIYSIYNREDIERSGCPKRMLRQIRKLEKRAARKYGGGLRVTIQGRRYGPSRKDDTWHDEFIVFDPVDYNDAEQHTLSDRTRCRLYVALSNPYWMTAPWLMEQMICYKYARPSKRVVPGILRGKIAGPGMAATRRDIGLIYFSDAEARMGLTTWLLEQDHAGLIGGPLPFGVERVAEGLGFADEPPGDLPKDHRIRRITGDELSFGSYLSAILYLALEDVGFEQCIREDQFLDRAVFRMRQVGVNPLQPQILPGFGFGNQDAYRPRPHQGAVGPG